MIPDVHEIIDEAIMAFDTEKVPETKVRNAILASLYSLSVMELGAGHELSAVLDPDCTDLEILADLNEYNKWETPNRKEETWTTTKRE